MRILHIINRRHQLIPLLPRQLMPNRRHARRVTSEPYPITVSAHLKHPIPLLDGAMRIHQLQRH